MIPDDVYVHKTVEGDAEAFNELVNRHHSKIYGLAYRMLGNPEDAADATQETFLEAYKSIKSFRFQSQFGRGYIVSASIRANSIFVNRNRMNASLPLTPEKRRLIAELPKRTHLNGR